MYDVHVKIEGDTKFVKSIQNKIPIVANDIIRDLAKRTQISLKLRVPVDTGALKKTITVTPRGKSAISVNVGTQSQGWYAHFQEYGYTPHYVSMRHPAIRNWMSRAHPKSKPSGMPGQRGRIYVSRYQPFVEPTMKQYLTPDTIDKVIKVHMDKAGIK